MALIDYSPARKRELLYTMNGKPIYRDELRPIGQAQESNIPWQQIFYAAFLLGSALFGWFI